MNKKNDPLNRMAHPGGASLRDLMGKQSVRATFRISSRAIESMAVVAEHFGIKQKSLFDHLVEDAEALNAIADSLSADAMKEVPRVQKTFVISRRTLDALEMASRRFGAPRDALVEFSIQRLGELIEGERQRHAVRKALLKRVEERKALFHGSLSESVQALGEADPFVERLASICGHLEHAVDDLKALVKRGEGLEGL
ncbi:hypothetical protein [Desulfoluna butyratoxydans]|uniref:Uncharacterized protein n=1 Tax=Desulfoluna butyratoxydans TaxID=231438 RepID=A0A4V6IM02_9BACT|nr:hypothetical protein [Desulfoluna butyratoxydans]VFQ46948.1 hypothetical protein MSL71_46300 [Desulfoluna butyratoxydans]